jgi:hypothetical protein
MRPLASARMILDASAAWAGAGSGGLDASAA